MFTKQIKDETDDIEEAIEVMEIGISPMGERRKSAFQTAEI
jgi:hypothetical protein